MHIHSLKNKEYFFRKRNQNITNSYAYLGYEILILVLHIHFHRGGGINPYKL